MQDFAAMPLQRGTNATTGNPTACRARRMYCPPCAAARTTYELSLNHALVQNAGW